MLFTLIFGGKFFILNLANCVCDESCREKSALISPKRPKLVAQTDFYILRLTLCNKLNSAKFSMSYRQVHFVEVFVCLFDLILYVPSTIFQLNKDGSYWIKPVLS